MNWNDVRQRLSGSTGPQYWRSLNELAQSPDFDHYIENEFPSLLPKPGEAMDRRRWLRLLGASLGLAGLTACTRQPDEKIVPYVRQPESLIPGKPQFYATAMSLDGYARGLLVESHTYRPTKVEGNPDHPDSLGSTDIFAQASVLELYDPDRTRVVSRRGAISSWNAFQSALGTQREGLLARKGEGLRILMEPTTSPTIGRQMQAILAEFPGARWHTYQPFNDDNIRACSLAAFGEDLRPIYNFNTADVIVSLDCDFLSPSPGSLRYARDYVNRRQPGQPMNRLYMAESSPSLAGGMADHRWPMRPSDVDRFGRALASRLGVSGEGVGSGFPYLDAVVKDLQAHRGRSLVLAGRHQPAHVHALAYAMNQALGNIGATVNLTPPVELNAVDQRQSIRDLAADMASGRVNAIIIVGGNPVFNAPPDIDFGESLKRVPFSARLGLYDDETSPYCLWNLPAAHYLESWSDLRAFDGTASIVQPLIAPLYGGRSAHELLTSLSARADLTGSALVKETWPDIEWERALHDGIIPNTAAATRTATVRAITPPAITTGQGIEISIHRDPTIHDGRFANNGWLQELPKPITKLSWDNTAWISPAMAQRMNLTNGDVVSIAARGKKLDVPAWIVPGQPDNAVTLHAGYGRKRGVRVGRGGADIYPLHAENTIIGAVQRTGDNYPLSCTQEHHSMENRAPVRVATTTEFQSDPEFAHHATEKPPQQLTMYPQWKYEGYAWGMTIDTNACIGCSACTIACQAENNIAVVGKEQVARGREMHWIRVDRYWEGAPENPSTYFQPVPCMHCETAPCEVVCPVAATAHSAEGLNQMVYNRCVGTRYCSNNCPYKVRRFNFLLYSDWYTESLQGVRNPDVTVRSRGVMEKCTYCVQRIQAAKIESEKEGRRVVDGEIKTACQQVCPTQAIMFGDINDADSAVAKLKKDPRNYGLLEDLNTRPRTTYLARLRNPNPEIEPPQRREPHGS